jgi:putative toxin-antitoxin system antitoxin component (TIGR02293 family)
MAKVITNPDPAEAFLIKYAHNYDTEISIVESSQKGIYASVIMQMMMIFMLDRLLIEDIFQISYKSFTNYRKNRKKLNPTASEKAFAMMSLYKKGRDLFGSTAEFNKWLTEPSFGLGQQIPQELLDTITGIRLVEEELTRIEYGDLA